MAENDLLLNVKCVRINIVLKSQEVEEVVAMSKWECTICGYIYDPAVGDPDNGVAPGTAFEDLPEEWVCPLCKVEQAQFAKLD